MPIELKEELKRYTFDEMAECLNNCSSNLHAYLWNELVPLQYKGFEDQCKSLGYQDTTEWYESGNTPSDYHDMMGDIANLIWPKIPDVRKIEINNLTIPNYGGGDEV